MKRLSRSHQEQDIRSLYAWFEYQQDLIVAEMPRLRASLAAGGPILDVLMVLTVEEFFADQRSELDELVKLGLLSATEAAIRLDFADRVEDKRKDPLSKYFRAIYKTHGYRVPLEDDLLKGWKKYLPATSAAVGEFIGVMPLRDWLAHGRYWNPKLGKEYTVGDVFDICQAVLQAMQLLS